MNNEIMPIPGYLFRTPAQTAAIHVEVERLDAVARAKQRRAYRRALAKASQLIAKQREEGRKSPGQCRALERLGYKKHRIGNLSRTEADTIIARRVRYERRNP